MEAKELYECLQNANPFESHRAILKHLEMHYGFGYSGDSLGCCARCGERDSSCRGETDTTFYGCKNRRCDVQLCGKCTVLHLGVGSDDDEFEDILDKSTDCYSIFVCDKHRNQTLVSILYEHLFNKL